LDPFSNEFLKLRVEAHINSLYDNFKFKCPNCGLRFPKNDGLDEHLDWHFQKNRKEKEKEGKVLKSRNWFLLKPDWISNTVIVSAVQTPFTKEVEKVVEEVYPPIVVDETQPTCAICNETFEQVFDSSLDEWVFKDAIKLDKIYHRSC